MDRQSEEYLKEFISSPNTVDIHLRYSEEVINFIEERAYAHIGKIVRGEQIIVYIEGDRINEFLNDLGRITNRTFPIVLGLLGTQELQASGILGVQQSNINLRGEGVLLGFVDTGIDYINNAFRDNDGRTRIQYIWDQTIENNTPEGYYYGSEYDAQIINQALESENPYSMVPHEDTVGHGTFLASVAASSENNEYIGAAPESELIVVKLRKARQYYLDKYFIYPEQENAYESTDVIMAIEYMMQKAAQLGKPIAICIGIGSNLGGHDSFNILEEYLSAISNVAGVSVCAAAGNESNVNHHTMGEFEMGENTRYVEIRVPENSYSFQVHMLNNLSDRMSAGAISPSGEVINRVPAQSGSIVDNELTLEKSTVRIEYNFPLEATGGQLTSISIIDPTPGIWTIVIYGDIILDGTYHLWLNITGLVSPGVQFLSAVPNYTIVIPATAIGTITCGAYNSRNGSLYASSSWGPTRLPLNSPDLVAPGVYVEGIYPTGSGTMTGTSVASAITTGASALMLQWGIVERNDLTLNTYRIRAYLVRGCRRENAINYPSSQWGYGRLDLNNSFTLLKNV